MINNNNLSDEDTINYMMNFTCTFNPNLEVIEDLNMRKLLTINPIVIDFCKTYLRVNGLLSLQIVKLIKFVMEDSMEEDECEVEITFDSERGTHNVAYTSKTYSDEQIEQILNSKLKSIFEAINWYLGDLINDLKHISTDDEKINI